MLYKHSAVFILCTSVVVLSVSVVSGYKYTILMKDHELVGEDPVLTRELTRRMPALEDMSAFNVAGGDGGVLGAQLDVAREVLLKQAMSKVTHDRGGGNGTLNATQPRSGTHSKNNTNIGRERAKDRKYKAYIWQPDDSVVEVFALRMIEQAVYSTQYRFKEAQHYIAKYEKDVRFRMGYIFKQLERWIYEMDMSYSYMTHDDRREDYPYNVHKNLIYYSEILRRNFDITYTIYHLLRIHTVFYESVRNTKKAKNPATGVGAKPASGPPTDAPDFKDIDMNDPQVVQALMDIDSDGEHHDG